MTISINITYLKKMWLYKSCYMVDVAAVHTKIPFYILWCSNLWRYIEPPNTYKVAM